MIYSKVRSMNPSHNIQIDFQKWKESIYCQKLIAMTMAIKSSRLSIKNSCMLTKSPDRQSPLFQQPSHPACVLVAGTQRFFLAGVAKYCSVSQDVIHNELCKWLNKNGSPKNFAKRGTDKLFLYDERKNNHFVTWKDERNKYSDKSWALFEKYFCLIAIVWGNRLIPINYNYNLIYN